MRRKTKNEIINVCREDTAIRTKILSLADLKIELIDYSKNPYKVMCDMSLCTWGKKNNKWNNLSPETRFYVVKEVLEGRALPLALEAPTFTFYIDNCSRAMFDQIARARIGVVFSSKGYKDNDLNHLNYIIPTRILDAKIKNKIKNYYHLSKELYKDIQSHAPNWAARCAVSMYASHRFIMCINYLALKQMCAMRMQTTEMQDTVAFAWLLREEVKKKYPLLANYLRPMCDNIKSDTTVKVNGFANILGLPHKSDNRWKSDLTNYRILNDEPCTNIREITSIFKFKIPIITRWKKYSWEKLDKKDKKLFRRN